MLLSAQEALGAAMDAAYERRDDEDEGGAVVPFER